MFQTNAIMAQEKISYLKNKKEGLVIVALENIVSSHVVASATLPA